jgi:hypothetical protein
MQGCHSKVHAEYEAPVTDPPFQHPHTIRMRILFFAIFQDDKLEIYFGLDWLILQHDYFPCKHLPGRREAMFVLQIHIVGMCPKIRTFVSQRRNGGAGKKEMGNL